MKTTFEMDGHEIAKAIAEAMSARSGKHISYFDVRIKLHPIRVRRKHPRWNPVQSAIVKMNL